MTYLKGLFLFAPPMLRLVYEKLAELSPFTKKSVFRVSDQVEHKLGCTATGGGQRLDISYLGSREIVLSMLRKQRH